MSKNWSKGASAKFGGMKVDLGSVRFHLKGVRGADELVAAFAALPGRAQQNLYRRAIRPGLMLVAQEARALTHNVPVRSGLESRDSKKDSDGSLRDEVARAIKVKVAVKLKKGVYGSTAVRYSKRGKGENVISKDRKASLAHLLEWGFTLKTAWFGHARKTPIFVQGSEFMTSAFNRCAPRAERMIRAALQELIRNPGVGKKSFASSMESTQ